MNQPRPIDLRCPCRRVEPRAKRDACARPSSAVVLGSQGSGDCGVARARQAPKSVSACRTKLQVIPVGAGTRSKLCASNWAGFTIENRTNGPPSAETPSYLVVAEARSLKTPLDTTHLLLRRICADASPVRGGTGRRAPTEVLLRGQPDQRAAGSPARSRETPPRRPLRAPRPPDAPTQTDRAPCADGPPSHCTRNNPK